MENQTTQEIRHEKLNEGWEIYQGKTTIYANQFTNVLWISNSGLSINQLNEIINRNYDKVYVEYVTYERSEYVVVIHVFKKYYTMVELGKVENIDKLEKILNEYGVSKYTKRRVLKVVKEAVSNGKVRIYVYPNRITIETPEGQFMDFRYRKA